MDVVAHWVAGHWKLLMYIVPVISGSGLAVLKHVEDVDTRFDAVEAVVQSQEDELADGKMARAQIMCMVIQHHQGGDPLNCLVHNSSPAESDKDSAFPE